MKTVKFYTLGCKVNQYETQAIREQFQRQGFQELDNGVPASVCVINTCTVTRQADRHSLYAIRRALRENPAAKIVVTGCLTQLDSEMIADIPGVSLIVRNRYKNRIVRMLNNLSEEQTPASDDWFGITYFKNHGRAFLKIQDGCDYRCSYCKVCLARGKSVSRKASEIKQEAAGLISNGYSEIVLSGVCLGAYGRDLIPGLSLAELIRELQKIQGNFRVRLSSIEVNDITEALLCTMRDSQKLCRHLHIPVQSGDAGILKRMNRAYSPKKYMELIERIRRYIPEVGITTDVMVGFPGETEENFANTVELIKQVCPLRVHIFPYSRREHTPACYRKEVISENQIKQRIAILNSVSQGLRLAYCQGFVRRVCQVLVERRVTGFSDTWEGYTDNYIKVRIKSKADLGNRIIQARLKDIHNDFVSAEII